VTVTIKYGDETFYCEGDYDEVCKAIVDGKSLEVYELRTTSVDKSSAPVCQPAHHLLPRR
jgi:hypothetical protein